MKLELITKYFIPTRILDIGANVGQFHRLAKQIFPEAFVHSIEANPNCEEALRLITNHFNTKYTIALLEKDDAKYNFYTRRDDPAGTGNSVYKEITHFYTDENTIVETHQGITLQSLLARESSLPYDLIKIDTQGSELDIMSGGIEICKEANAILLEVSILPYNEGAPLKDEVINFMTNLGFTPTDVLDEIYPFGSHQQDILFVNNKLLDTLK